jgi:hypothetical protein
VGGTVQLQAEDMYGSSGPYDTIAAGTYASYRKIR